MNIMISVSDLSMGGAQIFAVRLAIALSQDNSVCIYNHQILQKNKESPLLKQLPGKVKVIYFPPSLNFLIRKVDRLLTKIGLHKIGNKVHAFFFKTIVDIYKIDVVNSHLYPSDNFVSKALKNHPVPIVITDHGEYRYVVEKGFSTPDEVRAIVNSISGIIYCSNSNAQLLSKYTKEAMCLEKVIYNGLPEREKITISIPGRRKLGISEDAFVFGMVARGIPEKGWAEAIQAFQSILQISEKEIHLILVGSSDYISFLKDGLEPKLIPFIHFTGYASEPHCWIEAFDVALLPTYFPGESLPNSIVEYLSLGKPVIATDIGGIAEMITHNEKVAGALISLDACGKADVSLLSESMLMYVNNTNLTASHSSLAQQAFEKFEMKNCINSYKNFFQQAFSISTQS